MSNLNLSNLILNKNEILKAEIGALLFNLGKTHAGIGYWKIYFPDVSPLFRKYKDYYQQNHFENELVNTDNKLKNFIFNKKVKLPDGNEINWKEFFYGDACNDSNELCKKIIKKVFFRGCENINSGIDKGAPKDENKLKELYISNAFGSFKYKPQEDDFDKSRLCFFHNLHRFLEDNNYYNSPQWNKIREFVFENIQRWYSRLLSDSRFPVNDVTLWDQAYMTVSMFKATLSGLFLDNSNFQNYINNPQTIRWSILGIQYDKLFLSEKGLKAASIKWYRETSEKVDNEIKKLLEVDYPIGNEVYRDETGIYFVVSENLIGDKSDGFYKLHTDLNEIKNKIQEIFRKHFQGEVYPAIFLTEPSRGLMNLGHLIEKAKENFLKVEIPDDFEENLKKQFDSNPEGVCQVCKLRLANKDKKDDLICDVCKSRMEGRIEEWIENIDKETIWLDELQDKNGKIALITLKFELGKWINGDMVNSLLISDHEKSTFLRDIITAITNQQVFVDSIRNKLSSDVDTVITYLKKIKFNPTKDIQQLIKEKQSIGLSKKGDKVFFIRDQLMHFDDFKKALMDFFRSMLNNQNQDIFGFLYDLFESVESLDNNSNDSNNLKNEIKKWEKLIDDQTLFNTLKNANFNFLLLDNEGKFFEKFELLKNTINRVKEFVKQYSKNLEELAREVYPFKYIDDLIGYFYNVYKSLPDFHSTLIFSSVTGTEWESLLRNNPISSKIDWQNQTIDWQSLTDSDIQFLSELILQFLLRKNPSPARLRRIWETTKEFFEDLESRIIKLAGIEGRQKRLIWNNINIPDGEYCDGDILFWAKGGNVYLITALEKIGDKKEFKLKKYGEKNAKIVAVLQKDNATEQAYKPYFTILSPTPISWQFIIPAENIPKLVKNIRDEYYRHFKYVYGKLPLHIGIIIQNYKRPLYVGIKALRKIRRDNTNWFELRNELSAKEFKARQKEAFQKQQIPEQVSDCENFYSLFEKTTGEGIYEFYLYPDKGKKQKIDTIQNSTDTEKYYFYPNTFDFEFLDTNTRRNDIFYKKARRFLRLKQNRPYDMETWQYFEKFKDYFKDNTSSSKLQKLISLIHSKLEDWDVFKNPENAVQFQNFMISSFINILELKDKAKKNKFAEVLVVKDFEKLKVLSSQKFLEKVLLLLDMFHFWHTSLKFENKEGGKNE